MSEENKKKVIIGSVIAVVFLLVIVVGATYAFFSLTIDGKSSSTNISIEAGNANLISLTGGTSNLHIIVSASDMARSNMGKSFYATTDSQKNYLEEKEEHNFNLANIEVTGEITRAYNCSANLVVTIEGTLKEFLQNEDTLLHVEGIEEELNIDLANLKGSGTNTYSLSFNVGDSAPSPIIGYLKLTNRDADQSDLADKQLNVTLTVQNLKCEMSKKAGDVVATNTQIESLEHMKEREDTLRRFQGQVENDGNGTITNDVNNYICFGTSDSETCKKDTDKYMYRIIGIDTETNELKLIKKEALNTTQVWGETNQTWETSDLQIGLNNNLFLKNQSEYPYMQDNNDIETNWTKLISAHNWGYGDVPNSDIGFDGSTTSLQAYQNEKKALTSTLMNTKIGLMYASDYYLSGTANGEEDNLKCHYQASESDYVEYTKSWMHLSNNDTAQLSTTNADTLSPHEWTISRSNNNRAWNVTGGGRVHYGVFSDASSVRPVFYISSSASIIEGNGSKDNPYIIDNPIAPIYDAKEAILANSKLETSEHMSKREDTLRRFQGQVETNGATITNDVNNYICFETSDKATCTGDTDKYLYRIIGIDTSNNELKLIKREALNTAQTWGSGGQTWANSTLQIALNSTLYLDNVSKSWATLIQPHDWGYGVVPANDNSGVGSFDANNNIDGQQMYENEKAVWGSNKITETKIGLIYVSDYYLAAANIKCMNSSTYGECRKSWMFLGNNDTADLSTTKQAPPSEYEWTMSQQSSIGAWGVFSLGSLGNHTFNATWSVRPVFYINSQNLKISGTGSLSNPYYIRNLDELQN